MRVALVFTAPEPGADGPHPTPEEMDRMREAMSAYVDALHSAGVLVAAEMLAPSSTTVTVSGRTGSTVVEDGPYAEAREALAGVFVLEVPDREAAVAWAERFPGATYGVVEVRPVGVHVADGRWVPDRS